MVTPTLRGLARAYAEGRIDRRAYVLERRRLIDGIVCGDIPLVPYRPAVAPRVNGETTLELHAGDLIGARRRLSLRALAGAGVIALIAALVWLSAQGPGPPRAADPPAPGQSGYERIRPGESADAPAGAPPRPAPGSTMSTPGSRSAARPRKRNVKRRH